MQGTKRKWLKLTDEEVLELIIKNIIAVDKDTGEVFSNGKKLTVKLSGHSGKRRFVRLHNGNKRVYFSICKLVWMSVTKSVVPKNFEIHHQDRDSLNDSWINLYCLHKLDHMKHHANIKEGIEEIPF